VISPKHRGLILVRPALFLVVRLGMLVLRAIMSKQSYGESELSEIGEPFHVDHPDDPVAELVLVSIGYLFLMEPIIEMWRRHVATAVTADIAPRWVTLLSRYVLGGFCSVPGRSCAGS